MNLITTTAQLEELVEAYSQAKAFVFDVESAGEERGNPRRNRVTWISLATDGRVDVIPCGHPNGEYLRTEYPILPSAMARLEKGYEIRPSDYSRNEKKATKHFGPAPSQLTAAEVFSALKPLFFSDKLKVGHNVKFDLQSITKYIGGMPEGPFFCTMVASFIVDNRNQHNLGLDDCLKREFNYDMEKGIGKNVEEHGFTDVANYSALDAEWTWKLYKNLAPRVAEDGLKGVFRLEMDVLEVICHMELRGADIDVESLAALKVQLEQQIESTKGNVYALAGKAFNINSVPERQQLLYTPKSEGGRGLKPKIFTPKGEQRRDRGEKTAYTDYSVSSEALELFRGKDPLVDAMLEYTDLNKLLTTYVIPYIGGDTTRTLAGKSKIVKKKSLLLDGRVHTDFVQIGAATGRFSSRNPNLQNVPAPSTFNGKAIRNLFIAPEGHKLVVADYSQIEPRVIASFSNDPVMIAAYKNGEDIYTAIADPLGVDRKAGKVLVLSLSYGVGPDKVADSLGIGITEAKGLLNDFSARFRSLVRYKREVVSESRRRSPMPYANTLLNRRRYLPELRSSETWRRARAERQAFNTKIQGSAADLIKLAMVRAFHQIPEGASLILTVHDELVTVAPDHLVEETHEAIRVAMEDINVLKVPLLADIKIVDRWGDAK